MKREVTGEEKRLWREATKRDKKLRAEYDEDVEETQALPSPPKKSTAAGAAVKKDTAAAKKNAPAPRALSAREGKRLIRSYGRIEATLDLHGLTRVEAFSALRDFIDRCQRRGFRHLLVITGKGRMDAGILKISLPGWLSEPPLSFEVVALIPASVEKGGSGALHVIVRRR